MYTAKETYRVLRIQTETHIRQKRPTYTAKETYVYGKRDLRIHSEIHAQQTRPARQKRPTHFVAHINLYMFIRVFHKF